MESKKREKGFLKTIVISSLVGFAIMMITMIVVIKAIGGNSNFLKMKNKDKENIEVRTRISEGIVHQIDYEKKDIKVWLNNDNGYINFVIDPTAELKDAYGKPIVIKEINLGDIIVFEYQTVGKKIISLEKDSNAWKKIDIRNIDVDMDNKTIKIADESFNYTDDILVVGEDHQMININDLSNMDLLVIQGIGETIWSINVVELPGYIKIINSPETQGKVEIDNNKIYQLFEAIEPLPAKAGIRKVVIYIDGYEDFVEQVDVIKDEIVTVDLQMLKKSEAQLNVNVVNTNAKYTVHINNKKFQKGDYIRVLPGKYPIRITADGYKPMQNEINLVKGQQNINIRLEKAAEEKVEIEVDKKTEVVKPKPDKITRPTEPVRVKEPQTPNKPDQNTKEPEAENKAVQIVIETEPAKAQVFIGGIYEGDTPTLTELKPGDYDISIEKEGYATLYTTIVIDTGKEQKNFLYELDKD